eukprot:246565_1
MCPYQTKKSVRLHVKRSKNNNRESEVIMAARISVDLELIIWYYIRNEYENKFNQINIPLQLKYLIVSFSKYIIGSKLLTFKEDIEFVQLLVNKMSNIKRFNLLFRGSENGFKSKDFHNKC